MLDSGLYTFHCDILPPPEQFYSMHNTGYVSRKKGGMDALPLLCANCVAQKSAVFGVGPLREGPEINLERKTVRDHGHKPRVENILTINHCLFSHERINSMSSRILPRMVSPGTRGVPGTENTLNIFVE